MATNNSSSQPNSSETNSKQRLIAIAAVIIVALLGVNAFLLFNQFKQDKVNTELSTQLDEAEQLKTELEQQYYEALSELEEMKGTNEELNALIDTQKEELSAQKDRIANMIGNQRSLKKARAELEEMRTQVDQYVAEINQLKAENEELTSENAVLTETNTELEGNLQTAQDENTQLNEVRARLASQNEELASNNNILSTKVTRASVIEVGDIEVTGLKTKTTGKAVKKKYAKNIDQLKICFNTSENGVAEQGEEIFHIRIINPLGVTMELEEMGSGYFQNSSTGEEFRFTSAKEFNYTGDTGNLCTTWSPNQPFQAGNYTVEVFNKGYLAGKTEFKLK